MQGTEDWYNFGIRFVCLRCGRCCQGEGFVFLYPEDVKRLADYLQLSIQEFANTYCTLAKINFDDDTSSEYLVLNKVDNRCIFLDDKKLCTVHQAKPLQCKYSPFTPEFMALEEGLKAFSSVCPGFGIGKIYTPEFINALINHISNIAEKYEQKIEQAGNISKLLNINLDKIPKLVLDGAYIEK